MSRLIRDSAMNVITLEDYQTAYSDAEETRVGNVA